MVTAMLVMTLGRWMYSIAVTLARMRCVIVERERQPSWGKNSSIQEVAEARYAAVGESDRVLGDGRVRPLCLDLVWRHGFVHGMGSTRSMASTCLGSRREP